MISVREHVPLAPLTTLGVGGAATQFVECASAEDVLAARDIARGSLLPLRILGGGSNILVPDAGVNALIVRLTGNEIRIEKSDERAPLIAEAGVSWDAVVERAAKEGLWGIENLAGIPGSVGAAPIQNIGAYGAELADVLESIDVLNLETGECAVMQKDDARFSYRDSIFKKDRSLVVLGITLALSLTPRPRLEYRDLAEAAKNGSKLSTPGEIGEVVRAIRARKFPDLRKKGTAGSFFKNPIITRELADSLAAQYPGLPQFPQADGRVKVSLAYILDKGLGLKGFSVGGARLFEHQPLVIAVAHGTPSVDIETLAGEIIERVRSATSIELEREVETFGASA